ncbi:hypothetical protein PSH66_00870 [Pseudomonas sp. FP597]|uniref:imm11 family protein n=1 Tax=Pseudomonas sp. FP597 TaxID=2954096 RepID=UPI002732BB13|nr:DUF1629 domain-containing protein [Pseudomonas sp. FP597]WLI06913.1 hypothetical protein PSH66_00870 [Pseudomonas sp. FP597]
MLVGKSLNKSVPFVLSLLYFQKRKGTDLFKRAELKETLSPFSFYSFTVTRTLKGIKIEAVIVGSEVINGSRGTEMKYYLMRQDVTVCDKWKLGGVHHVNNWHFSDPPVNFMEAGTYTLDVKVDGKEVDYSLAGYASVPVLSEKARNSLAGLQEVDEPYRNVVFAPVEINNKKVCHNYFLMIIETQIDCVDEKNSRFKKFEINDPVRPDMAGNYRAFYNLVIDRDKVGSSHIFRLKKYLGAVIVSEEVKRRFMAAGVVGALFDSVNGDQETAT